MFVNIFDMVVVDQWKSSLLVSPFPSRLGNMLLMISFLSFALYPVGDNEGFQDFLSLTIRLIC